MVRIRTNTGGSFDFIDDSKSGYTKDKKICKSEFGPDTKKLFPWLIPIITSYEELISYLQMYNSTKEDPILSKLLNHLDSLKKNQKEKNSDETIYNEINKLLITLEDIYYKYSDNEFLKEDINKIIKEFNFALSNTQYHYKYMKKVEELIEKTNFKL